jgi:hypothetical protein
MIEALTPKEYAANLGWPILGVDANKRPFPRHGVKDASSDPDVVDDECRRYGAFTEAALAVTPDMVVVDNDEKHGKHGNADFERFDGRDPRSVPTLVGETRTGGTHVLFLTEGHSYRSLAPVFAGTGIDSRAMGTYIVLPTKFPDGTTNGRRWLRSLDTPPLPAPTWLYVARRRDNPETCTAFSPAPLSTDPWVRRQALAALGRACARIATAVPGERDVTRHRECYYVGGLVGRGDLPEDEAFSALLAASHVMAARDHGWDDLERRVAKSLESGIRRPLPLVDAEQVMRSLQQEGRL